MERSRINVIDHEEHAGEFLSFLQDCRKNERFFDVSVKIGETEFKTHRLVLAMVSDYFRVFLEMEGKDKDVLELANYDIPSEIFELILDFAYTGKIEINNTAIDVTKLIEVVDFLGVKVLKNDCEVHLLQALSNENVISNFILSDFYSLPNLLEKCKSLIALSFESYLETPNLLNIPPALLKGYLADDSLVVHGKSTGPLNREDREKLILRFVLYYVNENLPRCPTERCSELFDLFHAVKLPIFEKKYLLDKLRGYQNLYENTKMIQILEKADLFAINEVTGDVPEFWKTSRKLQHRYEIVQNLAMGGHVGYRNHILYNENEDILDPFMTMKEIKIWIRRWDGRKTIGAISVKYQNGKEDHYGESNRSRLEKCHTVSLADGEVITSVVGYSGHVVDSVLFETNLNKKYGPFGGDGGGKRECNSSISGSFLHSFVCSSVRSQNLDVIIELGFRWVIHF